MCAIMQLLETKPCIKGDLVHAGSCSHVVERLIITVLIPVLTDDKEKDFTRDWRDDTAEGDRATVTGDREKHVSPYGSVVDFDRYGAFARVRRYEVGFARFDHVDSPYGMNSCDVGSY